MDTNTIRNIDFLKNDYPEQCADLIIADPPYYRVRGKFDFIWKSFEDYLEDVRRWRDECWRLLKPNGVLIWWGSDRHIAYSQIELDKKFCLLNNGVWQKTNGRQNFYKLENSRRLFPNSERFLIYERNNLQKNWRCEPRNSKVHEENLRKNSHFRPIIDYMHDELAKTPYRIIDLERAVGKKQTVQHWFRHSTGFRFPKKEHWDIVQSMCNRYNAFTMDYNELVNIKDKCIESRNNERRQFNKIERQTDIITTSVSSRQSNKYNHPTIKGEDITMRFIRMFSKENDLVLVPFVGSGTECAMASRLNRNFIGCEIDEDYYNNALKRVASELSSNQ